MPSLTRCWAVATVVALPLTLNASESLIATVSRTTATSAAAPAGLPTIAGSTLDELYDATAEVSRSSDKPRSVEVSSPKGTISWSASSLTDNGLPSAARRAYVRAAQAMAASDPACQLPWTLLAGVGRVESDHGRHGGAVLAANGVSHPLIIGVALNGVGPVAAIRDSDHGRFDHDKVWDRAVGPMQFIPSTWAGAARDGDGDGVTSPNDIDDAALAAAGYLCSGSGSVLGESAMSAAIFRYNASEEYVALVMAMERGYRTGVFIMPTVVTEPADRPKHQKRRSGHGQKKHGDGKPSGSAGGSGSPKSDGKPSGGTAHHPNPPGGSSTTGGGGGGQTGGSGPGPKPPPKPTPEPKPEPKPTPVVKSGPLAHCGAQWCLGTLPLDLGGAPKLDQPAASDYDGDGAVETNQVELEGLSASGGPVAMTVLVKAGVGVVMQIKDQAYS